MTDNSWMDTPEVAAALENLLAVLDRASGGVKSLLVIAAPNDRQRLPIGAAFQGCGCPACMLDMMQAGARAMGATTEIETVAPPMTNQTRRPH